MIWTRNFGEITQILMTRTIAGRPAHVTACYYLDGLLIDTGIVQAPKEFERALAPFTVDTIVNTHHHEDHIGNNARFQQSMGVGPALAHSKAVPNITNPDSWAKNMRLYRRLVNGTPPPSQAREIGTEVATDRCCFQVIHTPGHTDGHISLLEPKKGWLFTGDLFISPRIEFLHTDEDVHLMLDSLQRLLEYEFNILFCASGRVLENAREAVQAKCRYLEELGEKVKELHCRGLTPGEIRNQLLGRESLLYPISKGEFGKINLVRSFLGM